MTLDDPSQGVVTVPWKSNLVSLPSLWNDTSLLPLSFPMDRRRCEDRDRGCRDPDPMVTESREYKEKKRKSSTSE